MKRIFLSIVAISMSICLTGCGYSQSSASITSLSNQLDSIANSISSMTTTNPNDIGISCNNTEIETKSQSTQQNLLNEEYYKAEILSQTAKLKNNISKDLTLTTSQASAVKDLTKNLEKYTNSLQETENDMSATAKSISSLKKNVEKNSEKIGAKLIDINCNSNLRLAYYENLLNTLSEIENCLPIEIEGTDVEENEFEKNIDTYQDKNSENDDKNKLDTYGPMQRNIDTYYGYGSPIYNQMPYGRNMYLYGRYAPYFYGANQMPYGYGSNNTNKLTNQNNTENPQVFSQSRQHEDNRTVVAH